MREILCSHIKLICKHLNALPIEHVLSHKAKISPRRQKENKKSGQQYNNKIKHSNNEYNSSVFRFEWNDLYNGLLEICEVVLQSFNYRLSLCQRFQLHSFLFFNITNENLI